MTQYTNFSQERNILLIGRTGNGKSTLANVLTNSNHFEESSKSTSATKETQVDYFNLEINGNTITYKVIDTVGFGDTQLSEKEVMLKIAEVADHIKTGLNKIFFVVKGRITKEEVEVFNVMRQILFGEEITKYTTIVRTIFEEFDDEEACQEDIRNIHQESIPLSMMINSCEERIIHVNNPSINPNQRKLMIMASQESRELSREKLINHLLLHTNNFHSPNINSLNEKINSYMSDKERLEAEKSELEKQLIEQKNLSGQEIINLENKINALKQDKEKVDQELSDATKSLFERGKELLGLRKRTESAEQRAKSAAEKVEQQQTVIEQLSEQQESSEQHSNCIIL
jgi:GTP-binding protein EngB required for normal cell division